MNEGILIEIAARRRKLEDQIEALNPHLEFELRAMESRRTEWTGESNYAATQFAKWSRKIDTFEDLREDLRRSLELCRCDFESMADEIRKAAK